MERTSKFTLIWPASRFVHGKHKAVSPRDPNVNLAKAPVLSITTTAPNFFYTLSFSPESSIKSLCPLAEPFLFFTHYSGNCLRLQFIWLVQTQSRKQITGNSLCCSPIAIFLRSQNLVFDVHPIWSREC